MPIKPLKIYTQFYSCDLYSLAIKRLNKETKFIMNIKGMILCTDKLPQTLNILKNFLPSILTSTCYNENNYPFHKEVQNTEIGHLFEHILIENLCLLKIANGFENAEFTGITKWNWRLFPKGSFHITVNAGIGDTMLISYALNKSIALLNAILTNSITNSQPVINTEYAETLLIPHSPSLYKPN